MPTSFRIELDNAGMRELVHSRWAQQVVEDKAAEVGTRARQHLGSIKVEGIPGTVTPPVAVIPLHSADRARAIVMIDHMAGLAVEAKHRVLGGALG